MPIPGSTIGKHYTSEVTYGAETTMANVFATKAHRTGAAACAGWLVELGRESRVGVVSSDHGELVGDDAANREWGWVQRVKPTQLGDLMVGIRERPVIEQFAQEKQLVDGVGERNRVTAITFVHGDQASSAHDVSTFFTDLTRDRDARRIARIRPPTGERPKSVGLFPNKKDLPIGAQDRATHVDLRSRVPGVQHKRVGDCLSGQAGHTGDDLGCDVPDLLVAVAVKLILSPGQTRLADALQSAHPAKPWQRVDVHRR